jgi:hypothetical protein
VWFVGRDALGESVEIALRLQSLARPGSICVASEVVGQIRERAEYRVESVGMADLQQLDRQIEVYEIAPESEDQSSLPKEPDRADDSDTTSGHTPAPRDKSFSVERRILDEVRAGGGRLSADILEQESTRESIGHLLESLVKRGVLTRIRGRDGRFVYGVTHHDMGPQNNEEHESRVEAQAENESTRQAALRIHAASFGIVNALIVLVWALTSRGAHPWFLYPLGAWAIGLATHFVAVQMGRRHGLEQIGDFTPEQRRILRKVQRGERRLALHVASYAATSAFLFLINMVTTPAFPWFLFPVGGWAVGALAHRLFHRTKRRSLLRRLERLGVNRRELARLTDGAQARDVRSTLVEEARRISGHLTAQISESRELSKRWASEMSPLLQTFMTQIDELDQRRIEIDKVLDESAEETLVEEIATLASRLETAQDPSLRSEYESSIAQHEQQRDSLQQLKNHREILYLRIRSALVALKKLQMDFAHIKGLEAAGAPYALDALRDKSRELSRYLADLKIGYGELGLR